MLLGGLLHTNTSYLDGKFKRVLHSDSIAGETLLKSLDIPHGIETTFEHGRLKVSSIIDLEYWEHVTIHEAL